ncbi:MAG TPA: hypothetical protein VMI53_02230 [Opitutaceae bacterium]|nr:hypothetical protein [Opitutaceae bacterium]
MTAAFVLYMPRTISDNALQLYCAVYPVFRCGQISGGQRHSRQVDAFHGLGFAGKTGLAGGAAVTLSSFLNFESAGL